MAHKTTDEVSALHEKVHTLLKQGLPESAIIDELSKNGIQSSYAQIILANVHKDIHNRKNFLKLFFGGSFLIAGGLALSFFSYQKAKTSGSMVFYLFWGFVVAGISLIVKAFIIFRK